MLAYSAQPVSVQPMTMGMHQQILARFDPRGPDLNLAVAYFARAGIMAAHLMGMESPDTRRKADDSYRALSRR